MALRVYTAPADRENPGFLMINNYLNEYKTEVDKARVRNNLGIPDSYSFNWGNIMGSIESQEDLMTLINTKESSVTSKIDTLTAKLAALSLKCDVLDEMTDLNGSSITLKGLYDEILNLKINVAQNATHILSLSGGTTGLTTADLTAVSTRVTNLESKVDTNLANITTLQSQMTTALADISTLKQAVGSDELVKIELSVSSLTATVGSDEQTINVIATYSKSGETNITSRSDLNVTSSNTSVAIWNNDTDKITILDKGATTLTFSFGTKSTTLYVEVQNPEDTVVRYSYIGYGSSYTQVWNLTECQQESLTGTWNSTNIPNSESTVTGEIYLWVIIPSDKGITVTQGGLDLGFATNNRTNIQLTNNGVNYTTYVVGPISTYTAEFNITTT